MGSWAPWDYIIAYVGISGLALAFMQLGHNRAMNKLTKVYDEARLDQQAMIAALQSLVVILEDLVRRQREV